MAQPGVNLLALLPEDWRAAMAPHLDAAVVARLERFVAAERAAHTVYPPLPDLFRAFRLSPVTATRVVILGQDPYHRPGQAHGLSFSVPAGVPAPPSLRNILAELRDDLGVAPPTAGDLSGWAEQGVLLLNTVLTVRAGEPGSHAGRGWEHVTDAAFRVLDAQPRRIVFLLWGGHARRKAPMVTAAHHLVLQAAHPSPLARRGFRGSRPFTDCNAALADQGQAPIRWA